MKTVLAFVSSLFLVALATPAAAAPHVDIEVDPFAYALGGYSLHAGIGWDHVRVDLGAFGLDMPSWVHGNEGFDASFGGFGAKLQFFPFAAASGPFAGVGAGLSRQLVEQHGTGLASRDEQASAGIQIGWRIDLLEGFYATPWLGIDYAFGTDDVQLGGETFEREELSFFPTVHLGYRFR